MTREPIVEITGLEADFVLPGGTFRAVKAVDLEVRPGETLVILGESGSGKSVTIRAILALLQSNQRVTGTVEYDGRNLLELTPAELRRIRGKEIAMIPQDPSWALDPLRSIRSQLVETMKVHGVAHGRAELNARTVALLESVGIGDTDRVTRARPHELSGGMKQRVAIALAVACGPQIILADEPTSALDMTTQAQVLELFKKVQAENGMALVMVTHDIAVAAHSADRIVVMYAGRVVESGAAQDVLERPRHPYTESLLKAQPTPGVPRGQLQAIRGSAPGLGDQRKAGCDFAPRCPLVQESCWTDTPALLPIASSSAHLARCPILNAVVEPTGVPNV